MKSWRKLNVSTLGEMLILLIMLIMPDDSNGVITVDILDSNGEKGRYNDSKSEKIRKKIRTYVRIELT